VLEDVSDDKKMNSNQLKLQEITALVFVSDITLSMQYLIKLIC